MSKAFWAKRFLLVASCAFGLLMLVYLAKGHPWNQAVVDAVVWAFITSVIYLGVLRYRIGQNPQCALRRATPEMP